MDEIKIEPLDEQEEIQIEKAASEEQETSEPIPKKFIYLVAAIVVIFILVIGFLPVKNYFFPPTGQAVTVSDLFQKNLEGDLPEDQGYMYNQYSFILFDGLWYTEVEYENKVYQIPLHFGPRDLEDIPIQGKLNNTFDQEEVYITFNPLTSDDYLATAVSELSQNLAMIIHRKPVGACDRNETQQCQNRPLVDCTSSDKAVIYFAQEPGPAIELKGNCLVLKGRDYDLLKATDRIILQWYEVMN
ncbi:hypothetical protein KY306_00425 [Candidatus Woesearchaeota archaeon]|nr:hypothetical protein [Candidatus Woesearchaeota archaeon]